MRAATLILMCLSLVGCERLSPEQQTKRKFERHYAEWLAYWQRPEMRIRSDLRGFDQIPSYRAIVGLGRPVLPYLAEKVRDDERTGDFLAYAAIEIAGWNRSEFEDLSPHEVRIRVLAKFHEDGLT